MTTSKSYCVTSQVSLPPQPHLDYKTTKSSDGTTCTGWFLFSLLGVGAITLILSMHLLGGRRLFMYAVDPLEGMVPIVQQGELQVYPKLEGSNDGIMSVYTAYLSSMNVTLAAESLTNLFESYPKEHGTAYSNCWLENPRPNKPCFFDSTWVTDLCTSNSSYGYEKEIENYNPCFVMTLEDTGSWIPVLTKGVSGHYDHGFVPIDCSIRNPKNSDVDIEVYPSKGFSRLFFPASTYNGTGYLPPLVAVKLSGVQQNDTVVVECSVVTPNALILKNNGRVSVTFVAE